MPEIVIIAGRGRYQDWWHDHAATSYRIAELLAPLGSVRVRGLFPNVLLELDDTDLLVINSGVGRPDPDFDGDDEAWLPGHRNLRDFAAAGRGILALHQAANTFGDSPYWEDILGGRWIKGTSMHPPISDTTIRVAADPHPILGDLDEITVHDERYSRLRVSEKVRQLAWHHHDNRGHPVVWTNTADGYRTVYDALGHGVESYDSPTRCRLLRQEALWLLDQTG